MRFGRRKPVGTAPEAAVEADEQKPRLPLNVAAQCLGEACVYYAGIPCESRLELLRADGPSGGPDLPPYEGDSSYTLHGQICTGGQKEQLVATVAKALKPGVNASLLIALGNAYEVPAAVNTQTGNTLHVQTIASSQPEATN